MEILYTDITQDLTASLLEIAEQEVAKKKKVYYIVPSSMSFEKEKEILERINNGADAAVFDLIVTRFKQIPYYFDKKEILRDQIELSPAGMTMLFRKVLKSFKKDEIPLYFGLQNASSFFDLLVNLRNELEKSNLVIDDLPDNEKNRELKLIFNQFEEELALHFANFSDFNEFVERGIAHEFDSDLENTVFIVDGYSRFSAEEEKFISCFNSKVERFIIGTFAEQTNIQDEDSVYANALEMMNRFSSKYAAKRKQLDKKSVNKVYNKLTDLVKQDQSYVLSDNPIVITDSEKDTFEIWEAVNQTAEIEGLAKEIRRKISEGARFKEFTILLGDPQQYEISMKEIFELYEIPFFFAAEEKMSHHPLIIFMESLYAIKSNNYRPDDVVNLIKCQLYFQSEISQNQIDHFEYFVHQNKIQGKKKFKSPFEETEDAKFLEIENLRQRLLGENSPLDDFLSNNHAVSGKTWVTKFQKFMEDGRIIDELNQLYQDSEMSNDHQMASKHEQVWALFISVLKEFLGVFADTKMKIVDFLDIILAGLKNANYRQIPANVDVVNIKDYELVEPRTNKYVYAIGLSQTNFPRNKINSTLLSDDERAEINQTSSDNQYIEQLNVVNYQKATSTVLSLMNAATEKLVLSVPKIVDNVQDDISPIIQLLINHSEPEIKRVIRPSNAEESIEHIGNARAVIATIGKIEREINENNTENQPNKVFWSSIFRLLTKNNHDFQRLLIDLDQDIEPVNLSAATIAQLYNKNIYASVSAFERFYNCEFQYFIENTLKLEIFEDIDINSKVVGNFFHKVFETLLAQPQLNSDNFDATLKAVITDINSEYGRYIKRDATSRFKWQNLEEIILQTAMMIKRNVVSPRLHTKMTESSFGMDSSVLGDFVVDDIHLRGRIDRIDEIENHSLGAIDYKSSLHQFKLQDAYDGTSLQFLTYLDVLNNAFSDQNIWGALYLQFQNNTIDLSKIAQLSDVSKLLDKKMNYNGLILSESLPEIKKIDEITVSSTNIYDNDEFNALLKINEQHFKKAGKRLRQGKISINPVMKRSEGINASGNVKGCSFCPLKSICRFEANVHMNEYAREIGLKTSAEIKSELKEQ